jgi:hypothetical protein
MEGDYTMKKLALVLLCAFFALTLSGMLIGCDSIIPPAETEATPSGVTVQELSIELPADFKYSSVESASSSEVYRADGYRVDIERTALSGITPNEGYDFPTLEQFMSFYMTFFVNTTEDSVVLSRDGDMLYLDADTDGDENPDTLIVFFESKNAYWNIRMKPTKEDYATARTQCVAWAKTVTFTETN